MGLIAQQPLALLSGYADTTTCKVWAGSLESSADITITCSSGFSTTITPTTQAAGAGPLGEDGGYTVATTITGLKAFTQYTWTASNAQGSVSGSFMTAPETGDDFCFYFQSCDAAHAVRVNGYDDSYHSRSGFYKIIKEQVESGNNPPCAGMFFMGDHGYVWKKSIPGYFDTFSSVRVYDFITAYLSNLSLFADETNETVAIGRDEYRDWVHRNLNYWPQWGDHDLGEDAFGWQSSAGGRVKTPDRWTAAIAGWDAILGSIMPPTIAASDHTTHQAWTMQLGDVLLCAPDMMTNGDNKLDNNDAANGQLMNDAASGDNQVTDLCTALNTTHPFKIMGLECSVRYPEETLAVPSASYSIQLGAQQPLSDLVPIEYDRLFREKGATPPSLMDNNYCNGVFGSLVCLHGDDHRASVYHHQKKGDGTTTVDENFYSVVIGTTNGSIPPDISVGPTTPGVKVGAVRDGTTTIYHDGTPGIKDYSKAPWPYHGIRVDVYGSRHPKELHIHLMREDGSDIFAGKIIHRRGGEANTLVPIETRPQKSSVSAGTL